MSQTLNQLFEPTLSTSWATMSVVPLCCVRSGQVEAMPPCLIGMEALRQGAACISVANFRALGHDARLHARECSPLNDFRDAEAIA